MLDGRIAAKVLKSGKDFIWRKLHCKEGRWLHLPEFPDLARKKAILKVQLRPGSFIFLQFMAQPVQKSI